MEKELSKCKLIVHGVDGKYQNINDDQLELIQSILDQKSAILDLIMAIDKNIEIKEDDTHIINMKYIINEAYKVADLIDYKG